MSEFEQATPGGVADRAPCRRERGARPGPSADCRARTAPYARRDLHRGHHQPVACRRFRARGATRRCCSALLHRPLAAPTARSDFALRLPSWIFMVAAAALPLAWRIPGQSRAAAITWAALLFLWLPGAIFATQARPYALLFLVATAQTIAFARLIDEPSLRRAFVWTGSASLTILTHYMGRRWGSLRASCCLPSCAPRRSSCGPRCSSCSCRRSRRSRTCASCWRLRPATPTGFLRCRSGTSATT